MYLKNLCGKLAIIAITFLGQEATSATSSLKQFLENPINQSKLDEISKSKETFNRVELLHLGVNSKAKRTELVENAQEYIFITVPYWFNDEEGSSFLEEIRLLKEKRPSVDIKVMVDWTSPASTADFFGLKFFNKLQKILGKENVIQWNKFWNFRSFSTKIMTNRIHDKIFVVDGRSMISGGMNIGNDYLMGGKTRKGWQDTDLYIEGPAAQEGAKIFLRPFLLQDYFNGFIGSPFPNRKKDQIEILQNLFYRDIDETRWSTLFFGLKRTFKIPYRNFLQNEKYFPELEVDQEAQTPIRLIYDNPLVDRKIVKLPRSLNKNKSKEKIISVSKFTDTLEFLLPQTQKSVRLFVPYLTLSNRMVKLILDHSKRLNIEIITNSLISHDLGKFNYLASLPTIKRLTAGGVTVYEWQGHSKLEAIEKANECKITDYWPGHTTHTKAAILDGEVSFLGSHNMNVRSEKYNSEIMIMIRDSNVSKQLDAIFEHNLDTQTPRTVQCGDKLLERPVRTEKITQEYLDKTVKGFKFKLLPLLYPIM